MKRFAIITTVAAMVITATFNPAEACKGRGGYGGGGFRGGYRISPSFRTRPVYNPPQPVYHQPPVIHQTVRPITVISPSQVPTQPPAASSPVAPSPTSVQPAAPGSAGISPAEQSALQLLGGSATEPTPESGNPDDQASSPQHVGNWVARLSNGTSIELALNSDGSFTWMVRGSDKPSEFSGQFSFDGETLTLTRSSDNQQLAGKLTFRDGSGFNFKLAGVNDEGLNFSRQG